MQIVYKNNNQNIMESTQYNRPIAHLMDSPANIFLCHYHKVLGALSGSKQCYYSMFDLMNTDMALV